MWDKRYGMTEDAEKVESAVRALGLHSDEFTALADLAALKSRVWTESAETVPRYSEIAEYWRQRAQRWNELGAKEEHVQTEFDAKVAGHSDDTGFSDLVI